MTARNAVMKYLGEASGAQRLRLTANNDYEIISWFSTGTMSLSGLLIDDNGDRFVAYNMEDQIIWQTVRI